MATNNDNHRRPEPIDRRRLYLGLVVNLLLFFLLLFVPSGTLSWSKGWVFLVVFVALSVFATLYLRRVNPDILAARINRHQGTKGWDKVLVGVFIPVFLSTLPLAALDDNRYHWHTVPWWICGAGYVLLIAGIAGMTWAESVNKFFEPTVRIQTDRGHKVIDAGPYATIRHPGYVAAILLVLGIALALGSFWALIPAILSCLLLIVRTVWEDRTLQDELTGYKEYAQRVRYRLLPGIW